MGVGESRRDLLREFTGDLPQGITAAEIFCGGCLVLQADTFEENDGLAQRIAADKNLSGWQVIVLHDDISFARSADKFLWATWTRFDPARDIYSADTNVRNNHIGYEAPIVIDSRMKPWYPQTVEALPETEKLVSSRWREYFPR